MSILASLAFLATAFAVLKPANGAMQYGKGTFTIVAPAEFQCKSFAFSPVYSSAQVPTLHVQISLFMSDNPGPAFEAAVGWVEQITANGFSTCVETSGRIVGSRAVTLQWMSYASSPPTGLAGTVPVPLFTTGSECVDIDFVGKSFPAVPYVYVTAVHASSFKNSHDATSVWAEGATRYAFKICLRELKNFDGIHDNMKVDWLALERIPNAWSIPVGAAVTLANTAKLTLATHYSFCKDVTFANNFYAPPVMITTALHTTDAKNPKAISPDNNAITEWIESVSKIGFKVCMKDIQPYDGHHDPVDIEYMAIGDLDPCITVTCDFYATCKAYGPKDARCVCPEKCPNYEDQLCGEDKITYRNMCELQKAICKARKLIGIAHPGPCFPFILHRGRVRFTLDTTDVQCNVVTYSAHDFLPQYTIHAQASVNYYSSNSNGTFVHDAAVAWTEQINTRNFTLCALKTGRNDRATPDGGVTFVDYIAYQGSPAGAVAGDENIANWWDGTTCKKVTLPPGKFTGSPYVITTAKHRVLRQKHDAATTWVEDVTKSSFSVCLRELQNFDGLHSNIIVNWLAYETLPGSFLAEKQRLTFSNDYLPFALDNNAFCKVMTFGKGYMSSPTIIVTAGHSTSVGGLMPDYNSIATWIEYITTSKCRVCIKELHSPNGYDPVQITSLIIGK